MQRGGEYCKALSEVSIARITTDHTPTTLFYQPHQELHTTTKLEYDFCGMGGNDRSID